MASDLQPVDVICQHSRDGKITPMKIRIIDEDGVFQEYKIKGYRDLTGHGARTLPDGVYVNSFVCLFGQFTVNGSDRLFWQGLGMILGMTTDMELCRG